MFWDKKIKCYICAKTILEKNFEAHQKNDFECNAEKWRRRCISADIYANRMVDKFGGTKDEYL